VKGSLQENSLPDVVLGTLKRYSLSPLCLDVSAASPSTNLQLQHVGIDAVLPSAGIPCARYRELTVSPGMAEFLRDTSPVSLRLCPDCNTTEARHLQYLMGF
jgi:hypothetical protein